MNQRLAIYSFIYLYWTVVLPPLPIWVHHEILCIFSLLIYETVQTHYPNLGLGLIAPFSVCDYLSIILRIQNQMSFFSFLGEKKLSL